MGLTTLGLFLAVTVNHMLTPSYTGGRPTRYPSADVIKSRATGLSEETPSSLPSQNLASKELG